MLKQQHNLQNPLTAARDADDHSRLQELFSDLKTCPEYHFASLRPFLNGCPDRFFNRTIFKLMLNWLKDRDSSQRENLQKYLAEIEAQISAALLFLRQINAEDWHDEHLVKDNDYELLRFIDRVIHPAYLRLVEAVLAPLIRPVAHFTRLDRGKGTEGLDVFNLVQELSATPMAPCVDAYRHTVRNGIGHGGITYQQSKISYRDKKGNLDTLNSWSVIRLCDEMIDTCNGLAAAIKVFMTISIGNGYQLPREMLVEELVEATKSPWWIIESCIETELDDSKQLLIYAHPNSRDVLKVKWSSFQSAILAEILAPGYKRYFISLRTPMAFAGYAGFKGDVLQGLRESGATEIHEYHSALEDQGFFYLPRPPLPRLFGMFETLIFSYKHNWPIVMRQTRDKLKTPTVICRNAKMHRNGWGYVLNGDVVISGLKNETTAQIIRAHKRRIIRTVARKARSTTSWLDLAHYLPLGYTRISVFSEDRRSRRLSGFGLGPQLICTIQLQRIRRIKSPDIFGSTIETSGSWRIAWNRAWIDEGGGV